MAGQEEVSSQELASSLSSLGETTTAAELVRKQGQSKKLKVISEKKLMDWILSLLKQHMAGKADAFSDAEKEELLRKTQDELKKRMLREQTAEADRAKMQVEYEKAVSVLNNAKSSQADYEQAMATLKAKLEQAENTLQDLQQDNYDLQDQLQEKMALLSTTISEKDKLRETVRNQMVHSGDLIGGVLGIDNQYYGARHQEENPVPEEAGQDEQFYHDFDTGAKVIETLNADLERLRGIAKTALEEQAAANKDPRKNLLESDLTLLEQLKAGNLKAMDVAQPVATLIEALDGARSEGEAMEEAVAQVTGNSSQQQPFTSLPEPDGDPSEVLAGAAVVARELAAELARSRQRVIALKQIADEAETERGEMEAQLDTARSANDKLFAALREQAEAAGEEAPTAAAEQEPDAALHMVESMVKGLRRELDEAAKREKALAGQVRDLARARAASPELKPDAELERSAEQLERSLESGSGDKKAAAAAVEAAERVVEALQRQTTADQASSSARLRKLSADLDKAKAAEGELEQVKAELAKHQQQARAQQQAAKAVANHLLKAAKGDEQLADASADLALALEQAGDSSSVDEIAKQVQETAAALSARKLELQKDHERATAELERAKTQLAQAQTERDQSRQRERELAGVLVSAAKGDAELADASADLALALEEAKPGEALPAEVAPRIASTVSSLSARKHALADEAERLKSEIESARAKMQEADERARALEAERDEMAESGKEIITQLRQQKDTREKELNELREENDKAAVKLEEFERRMTKAEAANRKLAESLAGVATAASKHEIADAPSIEDPRMDLEVALSQLPSEGEEDVVAPHDIAEQIADSGKKLADALAARHQAAAQALADAESGQQILQGEIEKLKADNAVTRKTLEERDTALKRNLAEVSAIRREMSDQGNALAARVQELSNARSEVAGAKADLDSANTRMHDQEARLGEARTQLAETRRELDRISSEHAEAHAKAEAAEQNQVQLAQSLRSLGSVGGQGMNDPVSKAAQKLEMAKNVGGDDLASASKAFVEVVRAHAQGQTQDLAEARSQLAVAKASQGKLEGELANLRGAVVDREHSLQEAKAEAAKANEVHAQAVSQAMASNAELEKLRQQLELMQEDLRQAAAELEDYRAREGASSGHLGDEVGRLRDESAQELQARRALEAQLAELREKLEAGEARLKRQREELERRLTERDAVIQEKDRLLDEAGSKKADATGLNAQIEDLGNQLAAATERIKELESLHGAASKSGDLAKDLKKAQAERDAMREKQRKLESELAEAVSAQEELRTQLDEKRKEVQGAREEIAGELSDERKKTGALREEFRKLKEEVVGLRARLKKLTEK